MSKKKPIYDVKGFNEERRRIAEEINKGLADMESGAGAGSSWYGFDGVDSIAGSFKQSMESAKTLAKAGVMHTPVMEPTLNFQQAPNSYQVGKPNGNAAIVFGADRPATLASGWGARGANRCNAIDIVVGRMSSARGGDGPKAGTAINPSFVNDAARIYLSQQTDIDQNFGLAAGELGYPFGLLQGKSAIGIKADGVRVIGRLGIKLVTGRSFEFKAGPKGELDSQGGKISSPAPPIELIAGNNDQPTSFPGTEWLPAMTVRNLQGVAKGENVRDAFRDLSKVVEQLIGIVYNQSLIQTAMNSAIGINWTMPHYGVAAGLTGVAALAMIQNSLWHVRINKILWDINYTYSIGYKYVISSNVLTT